MKAPLVALMIGVVLGVLPWPWAASAARAAEKGETPMLTDKTLVAWVRLDDLTQRGGSVLTLIDPQERFDAIVFGERQPGRWMAGSDYFRRTAAKQSDWPAETTDSKTMVQVAIVYKGKRVALYRNAQPYAAYDIPQAQAFGPDAMVLIGLRYVGAMGEIGFLAGAVEDARVYDVALSGEQVAALRPNRLSDPKPLAWWPFEQGRADDVMKRFPATRLVGEARVADGKLHLDGEGYLQAAANEKALGTAPQEDQTVGRTVQTLFYKARSRRTGNMWDTWLFLDKDTYYLFYLAKAHGQWDNISLATSPDGVHWTERGRVLRKAPGVTWMGTGSTWRSPSFARDGKFILNFSEWRGPRQTIFFAESTDLLHWARLPATCEFVQDERWYERNGRWDCIWTIPKPDGTRMYGYWTATPKKGTGGQFGFGHSADGVAWEAIAPPKVEGVSDGEVGAVQKIGGRYYMMFGHYPAMRTLVAERPEGPFLAARKNLVLLHKDTYFSRFLRTPNALLVNHHAIARNGQVYFAPLKEAVVDGEGTLRLGWWRGNEKMKHQALAVQPPGPAAPRDRLAMLQTLFDAASGVILEGTLALPAAKGRRRRGLYVECGKGAGGAVLINSQGLAELGTMQGDGSGFRGEKTVSRETAFGTPARFRLVLKGSLMEFYLDDVLIECSSLPADATGRIGLIGHDEPQAFGELKAWGVSCDDQGKVGR